MWQRGEDIFAEVRLGDEASVSAGSYRAHPALLDAALHAVLLPRLETSAGPQVPFSWRGVRLHAPGASALRVHVTATGRDAVAMHVCDLAGQPIATVDSLVLRPVSVEQITSVAAQDSLFRLDWAAYRRGWLGYQPRSSGGRCSANTSRTWPRRWRWPPR
jgi:hypothetical protein